MCAPAFSACTRTASTSSGERTYLASVTPPQPPESVTPLSAASSSLPHRERTMHPVWKKTTSSSPAAPVHPSGLLEFSGSRNVGHAERREVESAGVQRPGNHRSVRDDIPVVLDEDVHAAERMLPILVAERLVRAAIRRVAQGSDRRQFVPGEVGGLDLSKRCHLYHREVGATRNVQRSHATWLTTSAPIGMPAAYSPPHAAPATFAAPSSVRLPVTRCAPP